MGAHLPVLAPEIIKLLDVRPGGVYVDCTVNGGGHAGAMLDASAPDGIVIGLDLDGGMIERTRKRYEGVGERLKLVQSNFADLRQALDRAGISRIDGLLADLGLSSVQLDDPTRGFSFRFEGPIDMRFDTSRGESARELIERVSERELELILARYGEEPMARRIARAIKNRLSDGTLNSTADLADTVAAAIPRKRHSRRIHPATRSFQALRIAANGEMENLERLLPQALDALNPGGRMAIIAYHSLEDRHVRHTFRDWARACVCPPGLPVCTCGKVQEVSLITRKPTIPGEDEISANPRARSAKLRVAERRRP